MPIPEDFEVTSQLITDAKHIVNQRAAIVRQNERYFKGRNPHIIDQPKDKTPDNRIPVPFAKMAVEDLAGYAARPGDIITNVEPIEDDPEDGYPELIQEIFEQNEENLETSELYEDTLVFGEAFEAHWLDTEVDLGDGLFLPRFASVKVDHSVLVETDDLKPKPLAGVRFYDRVENEMTIHYAEVYIAEETETWRRMGDEGRWILIPDMTRALPYQTPGFIRYRANRKIEAIFEAEKEILDAQDKLVSKSINEVDRYNALITLFPGKINKEFRDKLLEMGVIDELGEYDRWPEYLEKNLAGINEFYNMLADRLERLFHKSIKVPDFSDENFAGNASGIAIAYKLLGFEFKAAAIDSYFDKGLMRRIELINDAIRVSSKDMDPDAYRVTIQHNRNLPVDDAALTMMAVQLNGILSRETIIGRIIPSDIVDDTDAELERIAQETEQRMNLLTDDEDDESEETET